MPPIEKPLVVGRDSIMFFLQIENWDSVLTMVREQNLPIGKVGGRWVGKRENLQRWLDQQTGGDQFEMNKFHELTSVLGLMKGLLVKLAQRDVYRQRVRRKCYTAVRRRRQSINVT